MDKWIKKSSDSDIKKFLQSAADDEVMQDLFEEEIELQDPPPAIGDVLKKRINEFDQLESKRSGLSHFFESIKEMITVQPLKFAVPGFVTILIVLAGIVTLQFLLKPEIINIESATINGSVYLQRDLLHIEIENLSEIIQGDMIVTGSDSSCHIELESGFKQVLKIEEETSLTFQQITGIGQRGTILFLEKGASNFEITKKDSDVNFIVKTDLAEIEVTGTKFHVRSTENSTISVSEGVVKVTPQNSQIAPFLLEAGKKVILRAGDTSPPVITDGKDIVSQKMWSATKQFSFNYTAKPRKNRVLGFASDSQYSVGLSEAEVVWWKNGISGDYSRKVYGEIGGMYFKSIPQITDMIATIVSINQKMVQIDLQNSSDRIIAVPGYISYGYTMLKDISRGFNYVPLSDGIYRYDTSSSEIAETPLIAWNSPTTPLLLDGRIYVSSFLEPENNIGCFDTNGKMIWNKSLLQTAFSPLLDVDGFLYICDTAGMVYKISLTGEIKKRSILPEAVTARMAVYKTGLYALANDGWLYRIDTKLLTVKKLFQVDDKPDKSIYLFKAPFIKDNRLLIGTDRGTLLAHNFTDGKTTEIQLGKSGVPVTSTICQQSDASWLIGDKEGNTFLIEYR